MKCPACGAEVPENSNFCPTCGAKIVKQELSEPKERIDDPAHQAINYSTTAGGEVDASYRNEPSFKAKVVTMNILGAISTVFSGVSCYASIMLKFGEVTDPDFTATLVVFLILGMVVGLLLTFVFVLPMGKKCFPDNKPKGFLENLPGVFVGLSMAAIVVALVFQGFYLIVS